MKSKKLGLELTEDSAAQKTFGDWRKEINGTQSSNMTIIDEAVGQLQEDVQTLNDGGLVLKDTVIDSSVKSWLTAHPEATTTVQDGSITANKLAPAVKQSVEDVPGLKQDLTNLANMEDGNVKFDTSSAYPLGFRSGYFDVSSGTSSTSANFARTIGCLNLSITAKYFKVTPNTGHSCRVVAFSSPSPNFTNGASNESIFVWGEEIVSSKEYEIKTGEYYFVSEKVSYASITADVLPVVNVVTGLSKEIKKIKEEIENNSSEIENAEETISAIKADTDVREKYLHDGFKLIKTSEEYTDGKISASASTGEVVTSFTVSGNWKTTKMTECPKGGELIIDASDAYAVIVAFYDEKENYNSITYLEHNSVQPGSVKKYDCLGSYYTLSQNAARPKLPSVYANSKGNGYQNVTPYAADEKALYDKVMADIDDNTLVFSCVADTHMNEYQARGSEAERHASDFVSISEMIGVDFMLHLGDMVDQNYWTLSSPIPANELHLKKMMQRYKSSYLPFVYTQGHHELMPIVSTGDGSNVWSYSPHKCNGICGRYTSGLSVTKHSESSSQYIDFDWKNVRLIVLDSCSYTSNGFSTSVLSFLTEALNTDKPVIVTSHCATMRYGDVDVANGERVQTALLNHIANGGKVLAHLHGHYHSDNYNIIGSGSNSYPLISIGCGCAEDSVSSKTGMAHFKPTTRNYADVSQYLFDIVCVHTDTGRVNAYRFGAGEDLLV